MEETDVKFRVVIAACQTVLVACEPTTWRRTNYPVEVFTGDRHLVALVVDPNEHCFVPSNASNLIEATPFGIAIRCHWFDQPLSAAIAARAHMRGEVGKGRLRV